MANKRLSMRKIREVLRLCWDRGLSARQAAGSCGVSRGTVGNILDRAGGPAFVASSRGPR